MRKFCLCMVSHITLNKMRVMLPDTFRTDTARKFRLFIVSNVTCHLIPVTFVIPDFLTMCTNHKKYAQLFDPVNNIFTACKRHRFSLSELVCQSGKARLPHSRQPIITYIILKLLQSSDCMVLHLSKKACVTSFFDRVILINSTSMTRTKKVHIQWYNGPKCNSLNEGTV